ncbi:uncharacterized protein F5147DRAFT_814041 [Suillus discolor]|uniref:Uncharacterized protein n=1 Tax=Suillus discolor TaxID=1912936 RepID=A0A9P7F0N2_9AGAM|nr:uncharacterized protein F5147DRAFT_814041 [Suillus discolor]KAG2099598.1 hypothetical protein F5147DRAFT_814041 [Suillus discolor]
MRLTISEIMSFVALQPVIKHSVGSTSRHPVSMTADGRSDSVRFSDVPHIFNACVFLNPELAGRDLQQTDSTLQVAPGGLIVVFQQSLDLTVAFQFAVGFLGSLTTHHIISLEYVTTSLVYRAGLQQCGIMSDLDEAIELHLDALLLRPPDHPDRSMSLSNLGASLRNRFQQCGIMSDLDESIELHRDALLLCPPDRFEQRGVMSDLDESIELHRDALLLRPRGHPDRSMSLNNLANSLRDRFLQHGIMSDLDEAIELDQAALLLRPRSHSDRFSSLNNLANSLGDRFLQRGIMSDLDEAIELHQYALLLRPRGHSDRSSSLNNLAISLRDRFEQCGITSDLDEAIELHREALLLRPCSHPERSSSLNDLALSLQDRFHQRGVQSDIHEAFSLYSQLSHLSHAASRSDLRVAKSWVAFADTLNHASALLAYKTALKFLDQQVALLSPSFHHFDVFTLQGGCFFPRHRCFFMQLELVEQGRAVFWTQLARFSMPLDELSVSVSRIRKLPDFSRFLLPPLFSDLQKAAEDGPVIIVNTSQYRCDTLIVLSNQNPVHVPIGITHTEVSDLSSKFQSLSKQFGSLDAQLKLVSILRKLWHGVVGPVVQALKVSNICPGSRIWWCPTAEFALLPLHAAGAYEKKRDCLSHIYISSYTPTLATLVRARKQVSRDGSPQHFVAIGQGNPDGGKPLECVAPEIAIVAKCLAPAVSSFTSLEDSNTHLRQQFSVLLKHTFLPPEFSCSASLEPRSPLLTLWIFCTSSAMLCDSSPTSSASPSQDYLMSLQSHTISSRKSLCLNIHHSSTVLLMRLASTFQCYPPAIWLIEGKRAQVYPQHCLVNAWTPAIIMPTLSSPIIPRSTVHATYVTYAQFLLLYDLYYCSKVILSMRQWKAVASSNAGGQTCRRTETSFGPTSQLQTVERPSKDVFMLMSSSFNNRYIISIPSSTFNSPSPT